MDKIKIDIKEYENIINKLKMYKNDESLNFESINNIFENLDYDYNTKNNNKIEIIKSELILNCKTIEKIHNNNIYYLEKRLNTYKSAISESKHILENYNNYN